MHADRFIIDALLAMGWNFRQTVPLVPIQTALPSRYQAIPAEVLSFLDAVQGATSPDDTVWFLTASDYEGSSGSAFRWNEWEALSLEAADTDLAWQAEIASFWTSHLPFLLSVRGEYAFLAIDLSNGSVVFGHEPEFEEVTVIAHSFPAFLTTAAETLRGGTAEHELQRLFTNRTQGP